jgi:hypothetical protein
MKEATLINYQRPSRNPRPNDTGPLVEDFNRNRVVCLAMWRQKPETWEGDLAPDLAPQYGALSTLSPYYLILTQSVSRTRTNIGTAQLHIF